MLSSLQIENVAVIQKANVHFEKGLNVLTGETGAGKSILIDSINAILGITVPTEEILAILKKLSFEVTMEADGDTMQVVAPRYREDIEIGEPDLAEEVIREYGYDHITPTFLKAAQVTTGGLTADQHRRDKLKSAMCAQGFYEAMTLAFYADADLDALICNLFYLSCHFCDSRFIKSGMFFTG